MNKIQVANTKDFFTCNGKPVFYFADTVWNAFANATLEHWEEYLEYRRMQQFNVLQISVMPIINDYSTCKGAVMPFKLMDNDKFDFYERNDVYFDKAERMVAMAVHKGFKPALVLLWLCFVKDTASVPYDEEWIIPYELVKPYTEYVVNRFSKYDPIYIISGDTNFGSQDTVSYYMTALKTVKEICPDALTSMHIAGSQERLHEAFVNSRELDFYMYQSGHGIKGSHHAYTYAQNFYKEAAKRPIVNGEPCYDGILHSDDRSRRFGAADVRKALWQSLLSGAKAGFTYGAHGIWSWHNKGETFRNERWIGEPFDWRDALKLEGAWEITYAKWIFETFDLFDMEPSDKLLNESTEIRMSMTREEDKFLIYSPFASKVEIAKDLNGYNLSIINLSNKAIVKPVFRVEDGKTKIDMIPFNSDFLLKGEKIYEV